MAARRIKISAEDMERRIAIRDGKLTPDLIRKAPLRAGFRPKEYRSNAPPPQTAYKPSEGQPTANDNAIAFREAAADLFANLCSEPKASKILKQIDLEMARTKILEGLNPKKTIDQSFKSRIKMSSQKFSQTKETSKPILIVPEFHQAMYSPIAHISQDWLMPGIDKVPADSVCLLKTNQRFVEAFMVGLNHEMARELLWHEYPVDQRGTFFRQFWDASGNVSLATGEVDEEVLKDISAIHLWNPNANLGENNAGSVNKAEPLVLMVRGELLRRYSNSVIYAVNAVENEGKRELGEILTMPVFQGSLKPDVLFFGFPLTKEQVTGGDGGQGWFFVIQEQPSEPKFGLDARGKGNVATGSLPSDLRNLSWSHLAANDELLDSIANIDIENEYLQKALSNLIEDKQEFTWARSAADMAFFALREPVRIAVHGMELLVTSKDKGNS
jgi:hypothetical protein